MKIATLPAKKRKDLIIVGILLLGLPVLIFASYQVYQLVIRASVEAKPNNVVITNLTTTSATVTWLTDVTATGSVIPVVNGSEKSPVVDKRGSGKRYTHYVEITNLEPNTEYQFVIVSDSKKYTSENSKNFTFKTAPITATTPTPNPIHSSVNGGSGDDVLLFALTKDKSTYPVSAVMPTGGNWIMDLSALRTTSDKSLYITTNTSNIVVIAVTGVNKGAVIEGAYSDIFDSSGKLKDVYPLNVSENTTLYTYFPPVSMLEAYAAVEETPTTPVVVIKEEEPIVEEELDRRFRIVQQLNWIDMITGEDGTQSENFGEKTVEIVNLTDTGFTVVWISQIKEQGYIQYGTSKDSLTNKVYDERDGLTTKGTYYTHSVSISRLQPETTYYFEVVSGDETYNNQEQKFSANTFATLSSPPPFDSVSGIITDMPDHGEVILTAYIEDKDESGSTGKSLKMSTLVDENGKWILSIADSRTSDGAEYFEYTNGDSFNIDLLSTVSSSTHTESIEGIKDKDVEVELGTGQTAVGSGSVILLDNYGVLGFSTGVNPDLVSTNTSDPTSEVNTTSEIPKTGILEDTIFQLSLAFLFFFFGIIFVLKKKAPKIKMKDMIK